MLNRLLTLGSMLCGALFLVSCAGTHQPKSLSASEIATPAHSMSHEEYPFDDGGAYVDAWAQEGANRYRSTTDSDSDDRPVRRDIKKEKPPVAKPKASTTKSKPSAKPTTKSSTKSSTKPPAKKAAPTKAAAKPKSVSVTVKNGDTLYGLGRRYNSSVQAIKSANGLSSDVLRNGRKLTIPVK